MKKSVFHSEIIVDYIGGGAYLNGIKDYLNKRMSREGYKVTFKARMNCQEYYEGNMEREYSHSLYVRVGWE